MSGLHSLREVYALSSNKCAHRTVRSTGVQAATGRPTERNKNLLTIFRPQ